MITTYCTRNPAYHKGLTWLSKSQWFLFEKTWNSFALISSMVKTHSGVRLARNLWFLFSLAFVLLLSSCQLFKVKTLPYFSLPNTSFWTKKGVIWLLFLDNLRAREREREEKVITNPAPYLAATSTKSSLFPIKKSHYCYSKNS